MWSLLIIVAILKTSSGEIPKASCSVKATDLNTCLKNFLNKYIPIVGKNGIRELNLKPLDPFHLPGMAFNFNSHLIKGSLKIHGAKVEGLSHNTVDVLKVDRSKPTDFSIAASGFIPNVRISGNFSVNTKLAGIDVKGNGTFKVMLVNVTASGYASGVLSANEKQKPVKNFLSFNVVKINPPEIGGLKLKVDGLMPDNPELATIVIQMVNKEWRKFYQEVIPYVIPQINALVLENANLFAASCSIKVKDLNTCLKDFLNKYIPIVGKNGIPELNLKPLDPFYVPDMTFNINGLLINSLLEIQGAKVDGLSHARVDVLKLDRNESIEFSITALGFIPEVRMSGNFSFNTKVAWIDIKRRGTFKLMLSNVIASGLATGLTLVNMTQKPIKNFLYFNVVNINPPKMTGLTLKVDRLIPDDPEGAEFVSQIVNKFWRQFYQEVIPYVIPKMNSLFLANVNLYARSVPVQNFIPDFKLGKYFNLL